MAVTKHIQVYDTTLRDGCQSEDVSLTTADKVEVAHPIEVGVVGDTGCAVAGAALGSAP